MKTMKAISRNDTTPSSKSLLPKPVTSARKMKARPAPDFSKLHKKWEEQLQRGISCKKKSTTVVQPFDVTKPGTKFTVQAKTTVLNDMDDFDIDFEGDQRALDSILQNRGLSEKKVTGRTTIEKLSMSTGKLKNKTCTNLGKRRILGELPCDPDQLAVEDRIVSAKKALAFNSETADKEETDFEKDPDALISILNDTGIQPTTTESRQTFAGTVCRPSLLYHPLPGRQSCISSVTKKPLSRTETEALVQSIKEKHKKETEIQQSTCKSPFKSGHMIVHDSPFGQRIQKSGRNSIYGDYQICPLSSPAITGPRAMALRDQQSNPMSSPMGFGPKRIGPREQRPLTHSAMKGIDPVKIEDNEAHKTVKWAEVLDTYYSPCAVPKIKEKRTLFTTIDEIDDDDDFKENVKPEKDGEELDKRETTSISIGSGIGQYDSSSASSTTAQMTHSKLLEPRKQQHSTSNSTPSKVQSEHGSPRNASVKQPTTRSTPAAKRIPITCHDLRSQNCFTGENSQNIEPLFHRSGISTLPKQGGVEDETDNHVPRPHSPSNHNGIRTLCDSVVNDKCGDLLSIPQEHSVMAMHTEENEESDDSEHVQSGSVTRNIENKTTSDNDSVDRFVGRVKNRKRQSIVELNESILESQAHIDKLKDENKKLQDVKESQESSGNQINLNIMQQINLIANQQAMLTKLQEQLKQQLQQQMTDPVSMVTTPVSHDTKDVSSALEDNNNENSNLGNIALTNRQQRTENVLNNNLTSATFLHDNQSISNSLSVFASSSVAYSQTLSPSHSWSKNLTLTPSKRQARSALTSDCEVTPFVTKTFQHTSGNLNQNFQEQIMNPTPVKPATSCVANLFPSTAPPMWTPLAYKEASHDQQTELAQNVCDSDIITCTSQVAALDLTVKRPMEKDNSQTNQATLESHKALVSPVQNQVSVEKHTTPVSPVRSSHNSAFTRVSSPSSVGSLSLRANTIQSPADFSSKKKRLSLRRTVISVSDEKYLDALLDEECALYSCRLQSIEEPGCSSHSCANPVARMLVEGDDTHFIPIRDDSPIRHCVVREGSAFTCYSP